MAEIQALCTDGGNTQNRHYKQFKHSWRHLILNNNIFLVLGRENHEYIFFK